MRKIIFDEIFAVIALFAAFLFGERDGLFNVLVAFVVLDYLTGVICAVMSKKMSSKVGFIGILKKFLMFIIVAVANMIDVWIVGAGGVLRSAVIFFFIANEGISILENSANTGIPIPKKLLGILEQLKTNEGKKREENNE